MEELYTVEDVATVLGLRPQQIYTMLRNKILPFIRIGNGRGVVRIKQSDLEEYMKHGNKRVRGDSK